jgi:hypothetical protein
VNLLEAIHSDSCNLAGKSFILLINLTVRNHFIISLF